MATDREMLELLVNEIKEMKSDINEEAKKVMDRMAGDVSFLVGHFAL